MDSSQNPATPATPNKKNRGKFFTIIFIFILVIAGGITYALTRPQETVTEQTNTTQEPTQADGSAIMLITSSKKQLSVGEVSDFKVYVDSADAEVNAVEVVASFLDDIFELVDINYEGSGFSVQAEEKTANGKITLQRGALKNVMGETLVATVQLKAVKPASDAAIKIEEGSKVLQASNSKNILNDKQGAAVKVTEE